MATEDQVLRAGAKAIDFHMRFYVGGKWSDVDLDNIRAGQPWSPTVSTALSQAVGPTDVEISVLDASQLTTGAVVISPTDPTQCYELVSYERIEDNTLKGCLRSVLAADSEYDLSHNAGDLVSEWVEITDRVRRAEDSEEIRDGIGSWRATLEGDFYHSVLLDNDNAVLCLAQWRPSNGDPDLWTEWRVHWLGFIREVGIEDDWTQKYQWRAEVESWTQYLDTTDAPATAYGKVDLAREKSVQVSSTLVDPYTEIGSGEFIGSPDISGEDAVDGDMSTLWISEASPVVDYQGVSGTKGLRINELYLRPVSGMPTGLKWVELVFVGGEGEYTNVGDVGLHWTKTSYKLLKSSCGPGNPGCMPFYVVPENNWLNLPDCTLGGGEFVVFTSNKSAFLEHWGETGAKGVFDWRHLVNEGGTFDPEPDHGRIGIFHGGGACDDTVIWGDDDNHNWYDLTDKFENDYSAPTGWGGPALPTMDDFECPRGCSYHRYPDGENGEGTDKANFRLRDDDPKFAEFAPTPGATAKSADPEWIAVDMGELGIALTNELPVDGETVYLSSTLGLATAGVVQIDYEQIYYGVRDDEANQLLTLTRGYNDTTPAIHLVDSIVYPVEDEVAFNCYQVSQVGWKRRTCIGTDPSVPHVFDVLFSTLESPILPDDDHWDDYRYSDWPKDWMISETNYTGKGATVCYEKSFDPHRARWVLLIIHEMSDQGRAKVNELHVYPPIQGADQDITWSGDLVRDLLVNHFGLPPTYFVLADRGTQFSGLTTTKQPYTQVIRDLLTRTQGLLIFDRDGYVAHRYDPRFPISMLPDVEIAWDRENARSVSLTRPYRHNCSQVILRAYEPTLDEMYEVRYPTEPLRFGTVIQVDDVIAGSLDQAVVRAQLQFYRENGILEGIVVPVGIGEWIQPGQRHTVTWVLDEEGTYLQGRNFLVRSVRRSYGLGEVDSPPTWSCSVDLEELIF